MTPLCLSAVVRAACALRQCGRIGSPRAGMSKNVFSLTREAERSTRGAAAKGPRRLSPRQAILEDGRHLLRTDKKGTAPREGTQRTSWAEPAGPQATPPNGRASPLHRQSHTDGAIVVAPKQQLFQSFLCVLRYSVVVIWRYLPIKRYRHNNIIKHMI